MYRKLEPKPQWLGPGPYAWSDWDAAELGYAQWLAQELHMRKRPIIR